MKVIAIVSLLVGFFFGILIGMNICVEANASEVDVIAGYDYYKEPNNHNYEDAWGFTLGLEREIKGNLKGQLLYKHMTDVIFPSSDDPKGAWGELRGHIPMGVLKYDMPYNDRVGFFLTSGLGYAVWDFRENPFLQDRQVTVDVEPSVVVQLGLGTSINIGNGWKLNLEGGWFDTDIEKDISDNQYGIVNILDSGDIGLQYYTGRVFVSKDW